MLLKQENEGLVFSSVGLYLHRLIFRSTRPARSSRCGTRHGLDSALSKKIIKQIKDSKLKVQASIQGDKIRVTGKNRDDLQSTIALLKKADVELPLQFENFRD